ncbi:MAG TPA: hypothetical protein VMH06_02175 [Thermodesulfovibrionales bacterium]|nr:hypothetical protein [Thermodesulfovibrionales bacterium]
MKILYLMKQKPDETITEVMTEHKRAHKVTVVDLEEDKNYDRIVDLIAESDRVISW